MYFTAHYSVFPSHAISEIEMENEFTSTIEKSEEHYIRKKTSR